MVSGLYAGPHKSIRRAWMPTVAAGTVACWRCGLLIRPGQAWDLGHDDHNPAAYRGPEHERCSRRAGGRKGRARRRARRRQLMDVLTEAVIAVEVSQDRLHTSIVAAGYVGDDIIGIELAHYLDGVDGVVDAVVGLRGACVVRAVALDPVSDAANLARRFDAAGVGVTLLSAADIKAAHAEFRDRFRAGKIRHGRQAVLARAVRYLTERPLGAVRVFDRRNEIDVAPAVAAELAIWTLLSVPTYPPADVF